MPSIGAPELLILLVILLVLFGGAKLPSLARSLGSAKSEFERGQVEQRLAAPPPAAPVVPPAVAPVAEDRERPPAA